MFTFPQLLAIEKLVQEAMNAKRNRMNVIRDEIEAKNPTAPGHLLNDLQSTSFANGELSTILDVIQEEKDRRVG